MQGAMELREHGGRNPKATSVQQSTQGGSARAEELKGKGKWQSIQSLRCNES